MFASPHSGVYYPADFKPSARLNIHAIREGEDGLVDMLVARGPEVGVPLITGEAGRAYVDLNRAAEDLDPSLVDGASGAPSARAAAGLGVLPRLTAGGRALYDRRLSLEEAHRRLALWHAPYHAALAGLIHAARDRHGRAVLIDWHSMPEAAARPLRGGRPFEIILGDRHGTSCGGALTAHLKAAFEAGGWRVGLNTPFAGGFTTVAWGRPAEGLHAVQVEINRGLYLTDGGPAVGFDRCRAVISRVIEGLARAVPV